MLLTTNICRGQQHRSDTTFRKFFIGSTVMMIGNLVFTDDPPGFAQLNLGYRLNRKNVVSVELNTWKYYWPLGIPYGSAYESASERYPGHVRDYGIGLVYQRFWWKGAYTAVHAMNALQQYTDGAGKKLGKGYQLFMTYRAGYQFQFFRNRFFLEPSFAMTHWPVKTNTPASFATLDKRWPRIFFPEPGLHFGFRL